VNSSFFTRKMGARLRELRVRAHLTQPELALRLGVTTNTIWRLENRYSVDPSLSTVARYLQACAAHWSDFTSVLEPCIEVVLDSEAIEKSGFSEQMRERLKARTEEQAKAFARKLPYLHGLKPAPPQQLRTTAERLRNYRIVVNLVEQAVTELLAEKPAPTLAYPAYKAVARQALGILWRQVRSSARRQVVLGLAGRLKSSSKPMMPEWLAGKLEQKNRFWQTQKLEMKLVAEVQELTIRRALQLLNDYPELFPGFIRAGKDQGPS